MLGTLATIGFCLAEQVGCDHLWLVCPSLAVSLQPNTDEDASSFLGPGLPHPHHESLLQGNGLIWPCPETTVRGEMASFPQGQDIARDVVFVVVVVVLILLEKHQT